MGDVTSAQGIERGTGQESGRSVGEGTGERSGGMTPRARGQTRGGVLPPGEMGREGAVGAGAVPSRLQPRSTP